MRATLLAILAIALGSSVQAEPDPQLASTVKWAGHFGSSATVPHAVFCLMGRGFFQTPTSEDMPKIIESWMREHPKAVLVPIASIQPVVDKAPESKLTYVWVVDGESNLNIELVRQGCFAWQTQALPRGQEPNVGPKQYEAFVQKLAEAAQYASDHKLGVMKNDK